MGNRDDGIRRAMQQAAETRARLAAFTEEIGNRHTAQYYGPGVCVEAERLNRVDGEGPNTVGHYLGLSSCGTARCDRHGHTDPCITKAANAAIDAGRWLRIRADR